METVFNSVKITTESTDANWAGIFAENGLFITLEVKGDKENKAGLLGRQYLELLLTEFTDFPKRDLSVVGELLNKLKNKENIESLVIGLNQGKVLYLGSLGRGEVEIKRQGNPGKILTYGETASGEVQAGDILYFTSQRAERSLTAEMKQEIYQTDDLEEVKEKAIAHFLGREVYGLAYLCLKVEASTDVQIEETEDTAVEPKVKIRFITRIQSWWQKAMSRKEEIPRSKKNLLTVSAVLIMLLILSIFFNISHNQNAKRNKELNSILELVTAQYEEAVSLLDINPVRSRELLATSKLSLTPYLARFPKRTDEYKNVKEWLDKIQTQEVLAYKIYKFTAVPVFFDLTFLKKEAVGEKISAYREIKAILDTKNQLVYTLSTDSKKGELIAGSETVKNARTIAVHGNNVYLQNEDGVTSVDISSKTAKVVIKREDRWGEIKSLASFGGNIYLLDIQKHAIWKYIATDFGFSALSNYLNPDVKVDLSTANNLVIDGSVYISTDNEMLKFTRGLADQFSFKGISDTLTNIAEFSTSDSDNYLYVLDRSLARIVVFDKDGAYLAQYQWDELRNAQGLVASEEEKKIYVLAGSKIYAIDII